MHEPKCVPASQSSLKALAYPTVIKDGNLYRAYYRDKDPGYTETGGKSGSPGELTCYAESKDGVNWELPALGIFEVNGTKQNNVILTGQQPFAHNFCPFLDTRPDVEPAARFKATAGHAGYNRTVEADGLHSFASPDGIRWTRTSTDPIIPYDFSWYNAFDSQNVTFWSEVEECYVCYFRSWHTKHGKLRTISRSTSSDFVNWSKPVPMDPNLPNEQLYTNQTHPYFRAPHIYIALPTRYMGGWIGHELATDADGKLIDIGSTDILFMSSRAGSETYDRLFTEAFIRPGLDPERWGNRANYVAQNVVPTSEEEMSIYHKCGNRYVLRTDGFISIRAVATQGVLITHPLTFSGSQLACNYSTSAAGCLKVEIQYPDGSPVQGFSLDECTPCVGDTIEGLITWKNQPDLAALAGKPVRLKFAMNECDLYSFRFS